MTIGELIVSERKEYLKALALSVDEQKKAHKNVASEVLIEMNTRDVSLPYRMMRPDILLTEESGKTRLIEVNKDAYVSFDPYLMTLQNGLSVVFHPFHWNGIEFRTRSTQIDWGRLEEWTKFWVDVTDSRYQPTREWLDVVHNVTCPALENGVWSFSVDFGTAPTDALNQLFEIFSADDKIEVGSFSMIEMPNRVAEGN